MSGVGGIINDLSWLELLSDVVVEATVTVGTLPAAIIALTEPSELPAWNKMEVALRN